MNASASGSLSTLPKAASKLSGLPRATAKHPSNSSMMWAFLNDRLLAAHCIKLTETDIERAGAARIHVAHVPKGNAGGGIMAPTNQLRAAGANLTLSTDNLLADMIEAMRWALSIARLQTETVNDDWQPEHVFQMATMNGARALGMADELGSLVPGKKADIVIVKADTPNFTPLLDALGALVHCGQGANVRDVIVDGEAVVRDGRATHADETAIMADAQAAAEALWARARSAQGAMPRRLGRLVTITRQRIVPQ